MPMLVRIEVVSAVLKPRYRTPDQRSSGSTYYPRFLAKRDEFAGTAPHRFFIRAIGGCIITDQSNQFLNVPIRVIPKLNSKWQIRYQALPFASHSGEQNRNFVKPTRVMAAGTDGT